MTKIIQDSSAVLGNSKGGMLAVALLAIGVVSCTPTNDRPVAIPNGSADAQAPEPTADPLPDRPPRSPTFSSEAAAIVDRLESEFPDSADAFFARGRILNSFGESDEALWCWEKCLILDRKYAPAHEQIALVAMNRGEFEQAVERLKEACELTTDLPEARLYLGKALLSLGRHREAIPELERQTALQPNSAEAWFRLGQAFQEGEDWERAKTCFQSAIDAFDGCLPAWFGMSQVCEKLGEVERARQCRERFLKLDETLTSSDRQRRRDVEFTGNDNGQEMPRAYATAAQVYTLHHRPADAQNCWRKAAALDRANTAYREALGHSLASDNRPAEAIAVFEELRNLEPRNCRHLLALAQLHQQRQQFEAAEKCYQQAMEIAPREAAAPLGLARLYLASRTRLPEARRLAERGVQFQPTAENYFFLSSLCQATQDSAGARAAIREALRLEPGNAQYTAAAKLLLQD